MSKMKKIENKYFINNLFRNLSESERIIVDVEYEKSAIKAIMAFNSKKGNEPLIEFDGIPDFSGYDTIHISFYYQDLFFSFESKLISCIGNTCKLEVPEIVFTGYKRAIPRYMLSEEEQGCAYVRMNDARYKIIDISVNGISILAEEKRLKREEIIQDAFIYLGYDIHCNTDLFVKYCNSDSDGRFIYGLSISSKDWEAYLKIYNYIFKRLFPKLVCLCDLSEEELVSLYKRAVFYDTAFDEYKEEECRKRIKLLRTIANKPVFGAGYAYNKNDKLLSMGSVLRIYSKTFLGQHVAVVPEAFLGPKVSTNTYLGLANYMLSHRAFEYYINYIVNDISWHNDIFSNIDSIINDGRAFKYSILKLYEGNVDKLLSRPEHSEDVQHYRCEEISDVDEFVSYCRDSLISLESECYEYNNKMLDLKEIKEIYASNGFYMSRSLWKVYDQDKTNAFCVAEIYTEELEAINIVNNCRVYFTSNEPDKKKILKTLLAQLAKYYKLHGINRFSVLLDCVVNDEKELNSEGFVYNCNIGRVMMNRHGLIEYKKLLKNNFLNFTKYYRLTHPQLAIWYTEKLFKGTSLGNNCFVVRINGSIDNDILEKAINLVVEKHDALRLRIREILGEPRQYIARHKYKKIDYIDFSSSGGEKGLEAWCEENIKVCFDLIKKDLIYFAIFRLNEHESGFYVKIHHLLTDAWTMTMVVSEVMEYYSKLIKGEKITKAIAPSYTEFIWSEDDYKKSDRFNAQREYWAERFATVPEFTGFKPHDKISGTANALRKTFTLSRQLTSDINDYCSQTKNSVFALFMAVLTVYINKITSKKDIVIGTPVLNRSNAREKKMAGMFISTVPIRALVDSEEAFDKYVSRISKEWTIQLRHQKYPYDLILKDFRERHMTTDNLFDVSLSFQNARFDKSESILDYEVYWQFNGEQADSLDIHISDREDEGQYTIDFDYLTDLFTEHEIQRMYEGMAEILYDAISNPHKRIKELNMLGKEEKDRLLHEFNNTHSYFPREKTIDAQFREQAACTPDKTAVVYKNTSITYEELDKRSDQLAVVLINNGICPEKIVGVMLDRSVELVVALLAVLKSGGVYLPLDPTYPPKRVEYMLEDSGASILLTNYGLVKDISFSGEIIDIDKLNSNTNEIVYFESKHNSNNLAYIIYTSGSTGKPKGVMLEHKGLINLIQFFKSELNISECDRILQFASSSFDASIWEIFMAIATGATLYIAEKETINNFFRLKDFIVDNRLTVVTLPPTYLANIEPDGISDLRYLITAGSSISMELFNKWKSTASYINAYGPTETTICATVWIHEKAEGSYDSVPIGKPIPNTKVYILNENNELLPIGIPGELCVSGETLARGYLNKPELTDEKFIQSPFEEGERLYKTGDLAMWLPDGNIEFLGRIDHQVKIRGYRIELAEIENQVLSFDEIREAAIVVYEDTGKSKYMCAYFTSNTIIDIDELKKHMLKELPEYMIPSCFMQIDSMPLTHNGKIDRNRLPKPKLQKVLGAEKPVNEIEERLVAIWKEILNFDSISVCSSFFELGGDSLKVISLVSKIHREFSVEMQVGDIFQLKSIREISKAIESMNKSIYLRIEKGEQRVFYPLSSAQKRMYMINQIESEGISYNMPGMLTFKGILDMDRLKAALHKVFDRHDILKTSFHILDGEAIQKINRDAELEIRCIDCKEEEVFEITQEFIKPFDLSKAPLIRFKMLKLSHEKHILLFDIHHIVFDGISFNVFIKEIIDLYKGNEVEKLTIQYGDYALWQNKELVSDSMLRQKEYWLEQLSGELPILDMPMDYVRQSTQSFEGDRIYFEADKELTQKLISLAADTDSTLYIVLLSAYYVLLSKYTSQEDIIIGTPVGGRSHADLERLIGVFVNTLALRNYPVSGKRFIDFLDEVKRNTLKAFGNQDYQFEELISKLDIKRDLSRNPLFDTVFSLQNIGVRSFDMDDIKITLQGLDSKISKFDFSLQAEENNGLIRFELEYCTKLFNRKTMERLAGHMINILKQVVEKPELQLSEIDMLSVDEKRILIHDFNNTARPFPSEKTIHELFEEQVVRKPDAIAVIFEDRQLTYAELNSKSNRLARTLRNNGVNADTIVGIMVNRSLEMIIALLAVLKSGGAYLPIDPDYPYGRIEHMLSDSKAKLLLTMKGLSKGIDFTGQIIELDDETSYSAEESNLEIINTSKNLAYLIYTSGSTGKPKAVMIEHKAVVNFIMGIADIIDFAQGKTILSVTTISFDIFVLETLLSFAKGLKVIIASELAQRDGKLLLELITKHKVDMLQTTPSRMQLLLNESYSLDVLGRLKELMLGGEPLPDKLLQELKSLPSTSIYNMYGPTETTVWSLVKDMTCSDDITIGKPIANTQVYILSKDNMLQPIGVPGELCIAGEGLARGYYDRFELNNEKFVDNLYDSYKKMYKTGDLVKWLDNGEIVYISRRDEQVKVRGYRIELGEVESQLLKHDAISECAVSVRTIDGIKHLCAYLVCDGSLSVRDIREHLLKEMPEYMVPSYFTFIEKMPHTPNGKIDKRALPEPVVGIHNTGGYIAPSNEVEKKLTEIWSEVLGVERVSTGDNFFELGGSSLTVIKVLSALYNYDWDLKIQDFYKFKTLKEIADKIVISSCEKAKSEVAISKEYSSVDKVDVDAVITLKRISFGSILLTGVTGFLGIHTLDNLISNTDANIYCLIRGKNQTDVEFKLKEQLEFYFKGRYIEQIGNRIFAVVGDVSEPKLGLSDTVYEQLGHNVDAVIHTAALVKHYGEYTDFEAVNVNGTKELIQFAHKYGIRMLHVSTMSVSGIELIDKDRNAVFTENDFFIGQNYADNVYVRSKFEAENIFLDAVKNGLKGVIVRVGNLTGRFSDGKFQKNIRDNMFYSILKSIIELRAIPDILYSEGLEFTPVDCCASALLKILEIESSYSRIFHLYNHRCLNLDDMLIMLKNMGLVIRKLDYNAFSDYILKISDDNPAKALLAGMLNEFGLNSSKSISNGRIRISSNISVAYLSKLGFQWPEITGEYLEKILRYIID
ncbi:MAG: amino acid adenylation domain-containing protein [Bacillota bacterium]